MDLEHIVRDAVPAAEEDDDWTWTDEEAEALASFFATALAAALATPLREPSEPGDHESERPREEEVRVWSLHSPSAPLDVLRAARALRVPLDPLVQQWALTSTALALDHLLEAVYDTHVASKHFLSDDAVADRLGEAFFEATGERQARLSKAEVTVRRNIARRGEW